MKELPAEWVNRFERRLDQAQVPPTLRPTYHKWVKFYLYFCQKFSYPASAPTALGPFLTKMAQKNYSIDDRHPPPSPLTPHPLLSPISQRPCAQFVNKFTPFCTPLGQPLSKSPCYSPSR